MKLSRLLVLVGLVLVGYGAWTMFGPSGDPVTGYLQHREQRHLRHTLAHAHAPARACARAREGEPLGMLRIPAINVTQVVVQGTGHEDLKKGPGHYPSTALPGSGKTVAVAGHRTTWGAPFRHVDSLRQGDLITFCGVKYRVQTVVIVPSNDWKIIRAHRPVETLILSACHPLYSASHRIIVLARRV